MVDSTDIYKGLNINIGTVMKSPEMLKVVPDHLNTKKMCKHVIRKLPYLLRYVPNRYKTQRRSDKAILENGGNKSLFLTATKIKKYVIKQLIITLMRLNLFQNAQEM